MQQREVVYPPTRRLIDSKLHEVIKVDADIDDRGAVGSECSASFLELSTTCEAVYGAVFTPRTAFWRSMRTRAVFFGGRVEIQA
jgi:hypothetical protein